MFSICLDISRDTNLQQQKRKPRSEDHGFLENLDYLTSHGEHQSAAMVSQPSKTSIFEMLTSTDFPSNLTERFPLRTRAGVAR